MSWYSDGEPFDEYDPPYCRYCNMSDVSYEICKRCQKERDIAENEDYYRECEEVW